MDWIEASVHSNSEGAEIVSEALMRHGARGTQIIDRADALDSTRPGAAWDVIDQVLIDSMPEEVVVKAWFSQEGQLQGLRDSLLQLPLLAGMPLGSLRLSLKGVQDQDWAEEWKRYYKPLRFGRHLVVRPSWEPYEPKPGDLVIDLDPGMAFGTGTHESTALCMELLEKHATTSPALDVGTGSGILALAMAKLGASHVQAIDIDPLAVKAAEENARLNGLEDRVTARQGDLISAVSGRYALACANILADVIMALAPDLRQVLLPGAPFICSGIIRDRADEVEARLLALGYSLQDRLSRGEWVAFAFLAPGEG